MLRLDSKLRSSVNSSRPAIAGSAYGLICTALFCWRSLKDGYQVPSRPGRSRLAICLRCSSTFGAVLQADIRSAHAAMALYILEVLSLHQDANMRGGSVLAKWSVHVTRSVVNLRTLRFALAPPSKDIQHLGKAGPHLTRARRQQLQLSLSSSRFSLCGPKLPDLFTIRDWECWI